MTANNKEEDYFEQEEESLGTIINNNKSGEIVSQDQQVLPLKGRSSYNLQNPQMALHFSHILLSFHQNRLTLRFLRNRLHGRSISFTTNSLILYSFRSTRYRR